MKAGWTAEYERWSRRDLSARRSVYFWADGIYFRPRLDHDKQCILVVMGADELGRKEVLAIADGYRTLGLEATAESVDRAASEYDETAGIGDEEAWGEAEERVNGEYRIEDEDILAAIERTLAQEPELFAPTD